MNKKTVIKNILEVKAEDLKNNLVESFLDIIADYKYESVEDLEVQVSFFRDALKDIQEGNWRKLFNDGPTMLMLGSETFEYVEQFFAEKDSNPFLLHELEIHILPSEHLPFEGKAVIEEKDIQY